MGDLSSRLNRKGTVTLVKIVSVEQMQQIEAAADADGISYDTMFERVALAVADRIVEHVRAVDEPRVAILVGGGNNGGDGLVAAVRLKEIIDVEVGVYLVKPRDDDEKLQAVHNADIFVAEAENDQQYRVLRNMVASAHVVVDAIFGIGVRLPLEGDITKILRNIGQALNPPPIAPVEGILIDPEAEPAPTAGTGQIVIALDCPSGVDCDTGEVDKLALRADETITFIAVKQGLLLPPAAEHVGKLWVATLGIPSDLEAMKSITPEFVTGSAVSGMLPKRSMMAHKGTFGKVMIVAGSVNYTGAAGLAAFGAYRSGAGLVTVAAPMPVVAGLAAQLLEATWVLLPHDMGVLSEAAAEVITKEITSYRALLIGPGIGQEDTTKDMLLKLFEQTQQKPRRAARRIGFAGLPPQGDEAPEGEADEDEQVVLPPMVLDADALNLLATVEAWWEQVPAGTVITPHPGEMARLSGLETSDVQSRRLELAQEKAAAWNVVVVLKGAHTIVAAPDGRVAVLPFKTSALATAGTGDVLAGVITSLRAQDVEPFEAAVAGAYVHGSAGATAAAYAGNEDSVVAGDVLEMLGEAISRLRQRYV